MAFDPRTFVNISRELISGTTEAHYRSIINRAYYGAFGHIRNRLSIRIEAGSVHQKVIRTLTYSNSTSEMKLGKRLEALFKKRKDADYKHHQEIKHHNCEYCIKEAEEIIKLFDAANDTRKRLS